MKFAYPAIRTTQTASNRPVVLLAAPVTEIATWAGIPQKKRFGSDEETAGFQREENPQRVKSLREFFLDPDNVIQNPLLCATRQLPSCSVAFFPDEGRTPDSSGTTTGQLAIEMPDYSGFPLRDLFGLVRQYIEGRVPELLGREPPSTIVQELRLRAREEGAIPEVPDETEDEATDQEVESPEDEEQSEAEAAGVLFEESHILDFWQEVAARHVMLSELGDSFTGDSLIGFGRDALLAYLKPVVLVDGQHRLRGAIEAARSRLTAGPVASEIEGRIASGEAPSTVEETLMLREGRRLPVSLLLADDPAEQVFQFVVVNQKATPIGRALLGTIVSTTLSNDEMANVASRLKRAGIPLEESQAITYLARHPNSPFCDLVERGLAGDKQNLLQWNVFASLISIFRELRGGRLYHQKNDYAEVWRSRFLNSSPLVSDYADHGYPSESARWRALDGPWRSIFVVFWTAVRDTFANTTDPDKANYWGRPRQSNLFNKVSLTILAADFFQFLVETRKTISAPKDIATLVEEWLEGVNHGYFDKDWNLGGIKKDSTGIRRMWAYLWVEYRKNPHQLPDRRLFRQSKGD